MRPLNYKRSPVPFLPCSLLTFFLVSSGVSAEDIEFDTSAIENTSQVTASAIDVSQFNRSAQQAGDYYVTVRINGKIVGRSNIVFTLDDHDKLRPELTVGTLHKFGTYFSNPRIDHNGEYKIPGDMKGIVTTFDASKLLLDINIPQAHLKESPDADLSVPVAQWDEGISAFSVNYDLNGAEKKMPGEGFHQDNQYIRLNTGLNFGAWRLRNTGSLDKPAEGAATWNSTKLWLQHDIPSLRGMLSLGDNSSDSALFDGIDYQGLSLASDSVMYSDKAQGYAPQIRGIARTSNAMVEISQNGNVIDKRYVPSGPFVINDLYPQSGGGQMKVTITEADGSKHHFYQAWGTVSAMQRMGYLKYSANVGRTDNNDARNEDFGQLSLFYGLPDDMTVFGGTFMTESYHALDIGYALGMEALGSLSADAKIMRTHQGRRLDTQGQNYRFEYAKNIPASDTDLSLSWSFSPAPDYISYPDAVTDDEDENESRSLYQRNQQQLSVNQPVGDVNTFVFSAMRTQYWYQTTQESLSLSDNLSLHSANFSLGWAWTQDDSGASEQQFSVNVQIPLSAFTHDTWLSLSTGMQRPGAPTQSVGLNGSAFEHDALNWELDATQGGSQHSTEDLALDYKGSHGEYRTNYSFSSQQQSLSYQVKGSLVASAYGLTAGQAFNPDDAVALVRASHAPALDIENNTGVETDFRGYAIVPYLQPYRLDTIHIEKTKATSKDIELGNSSLSRVPTEGAIVLAEFRPHIGKKLLVTLTRADGSLVPFGATAIAGETSSEGIVDENGNVYLTGAPPTGTINVKWGNAGQECQAGYHIQPSSGKSLYELPLVCK